MGRGSGCVHSSQAGRLPLGLGDLGETVTVWRLARDMTTERIDRINTVHILYRHCDTLSQFTAQDFTRRRVCPSQYSYSVHCQRYCNQSMPHSVTSEASPHDAMAEQASVHGSQPADDVDMADADGKETESPQKEAQVSLEDLFDDDDDEFPSSRPPEQPEV